MKFLEAHNLKTIALTKVMSTVIHSYVDEAFDEMSEESDKKNIFSTLSLINNGGLFQPTPRHF